MDNLWCNFSQLKLLIGLISKDFNLCNYSNDIPMVCFLEVDLDYADKLH